LLAKNIVWMNDLTGVIVDKYIYWPHQMVGQGSFATVYRGKRRSDSLAMAVKKIKINEMSNRMNKLWSEIKIMKQLSHPNILKLYDVHLDLESEVIYLFLEWCEAGDLSQLIKMLKQPATHSRKANYQAISQANSSTKLTETEIRNYVEQIRCGLEYLHQQHILHRDLKPQNILIHQGTIKICDFGLSILADQNSLISTMCGSPMYMAPEVIKHEEYTIKADLWSCGVILYEMFYGVHPYPVQNYHELTVTVEKPINYPLATVVSESGMKLMKSLLEIDYHCRIEWVDFFNHPWFKADLNNLRRHRTGGEYQLDNSLEMAREIFSMSLEVLKKPSSPKDQAGLCPDKGVVATTPQFALRSPKDLAGLCPDKGVVATTPQFALRSPKDWHTAPQFALRSPKDWHTAPQFALRSPKDWSSGTTSSDEFYSYDSEADELITTIPPIAENKAIPIQPSSQKPHGNKRTNGFNMSQYIVADYQTPPKTAPIHRNPNECYSRQSGQSGHPGQVYPYGQSAPNQNSSFGQSYSPRLNFNSMGSQVYKCVSKSYGVLKKNL